MDREPTDLDLTQPMGAAPGGHGAHGAADQPTQPLGADGAGRGAAGSPQAFGQDQGFGQAPELGRGAQLGEAPQFGQAPQFGEAPQLGQAPGAPAGGELPPHGQDRSFAAPHPGEPAPPLFGDPQQGSPAVQQASAYDPHGAAFGQHAPSYGQAASAFGQDAQAYGQGAHGVPAPQPIPGYQPPAAQPARSNRGLKGLLIAGIAALAIAAIVLAVIFVPRLFGCGDQPAGDPSAASEPAGGASAETTLSTSAGEVTAPVEVADDGATFYVGPADAKITIDHWYDFSCPHCVVYHQEVGPTIRDLIGTGEVRFAFHPLNVAAPYGAQAAAALTSAVQRDPSLFYPLYDALYTLPANQQFGMGGQEYADFLREHGVTDEQALADVEAGAYVQQVEDNTTAAMEAGVPGTPSIGVGGEVEPETPDGAGLVALAEAAGVDTSNVVK